MPAPASLPTASGSASVSGTFGPAFAQSLCLEVCDLGCDRGGAGIVRGFDLEVRSGEAVQLFGDNGSGKSTILQALAGVIRPATGRICWWTGTGQARQALDAIRPATVFSGHGLALKPALTVRENLEFWARGYGANDEAITSAIATLELAGLTHTLVGRLSGGQQRRAGLARCLIAGRPVWLLDEPTALLDMDGHGLVGALVRAHLARGGLAVIATHRRLDIASLDIRLTMGEGA